MPRFDYFVAPLRCPRCGQVTPGDGSEDCQTRAARRPELADRHVGDTFEVAVGDMDDYAVMREPRPGDPIHLLETWDCPLCDATYNWAEIVVDGGRIASIESVELSGDVIGRVHYIPAEEIADVVRNFEIEGAGQIAGRPLVERIRACFPPPGDRERSP